VRSGACFPIDCRLALAFFPLHLMANERLKRLRPTNPSVCTPRLRPMAGSIHAFYRKGNWETGILHGSFLGQWSWGLHKHFSGMRGHPAVLRSHFTKRAAEGSASTQWELEARNRLSTAMAAPMPAWVLISPITTTTGCPTWWSPIPRTRLTPYSRTWGTAYLTMPVARLESAP
jgi:hypothetical protein